MCLFQTNAYLTFRREEEHTLPKDDKEDPIYCKINYDSKNQNQNGGTLQKPVASFFFLFKFQEQLQIRSLLEY